MGFATEFLGSLAFKGGMAALQLGVAYAECGLDGACASAVWPVIAPACVWCFIVFMAFPIGGQLNPSVTIGAWASGGQSFGDTLKHLVAQVAGCAAAVVVVRRAAALLGGGALLGLVGAHAYPAAFSAGEAWAHEALSTGALVFAIECASALFGGSPWLQPMAIASTVVLVLTRTGANMDPSAQFHGAFFTGEYGDLVGLYWSAALTGAGLAAFAFAGLGLGGALPNLGRHFPSAAATETPLLVLLAAAAGYVAVHAPPAFEACAAAGAGASPLCVGRAIAPALFEYVGLPAPPPPARAKFLGLF